MFYFFLVSKQTLNADIQSLKKGIDLTKTERDKQPNNFILFVSFSPVNFILHRKNAHTSMSAVRENYELIENSL